jgi:hypothetical protein
VGLLRVSPQEITVGPVGDEAEVATPPPPLAILSSDVDLEREDVAISGCLSSVFSPPVAAGGSSAVDAVLLRGGVGRSLPVGGACDSAVPVNPSGVPSEDISPRRAQVPSKCVGCCSSASAPKIQHDRQPCWQEGLLRFFLPRTVSCFLGDPLVLYSGRRGSDPRHSKTDKNARGGPLSLSTPTYMSTNPEIYGSTPEIFGSNPEIYVGVTARSFAVGMRKNRATRHCKATIRKVRKEAVEVSSNSSRHSEHASMIITTITLSAIRSTLATCTKRMVAFRIVVCCIIFIALSLQIQDASGFAVPKARKALPTAVKNVVRHVYCMQPLVCSLLEYQE